MLIDLVARLMQSNSHGRNISILVTGPADKVVDALALQLHKMRSEENAHPNGRYCSYFHNRILNAL